MGPKYDVNAPKIWQKSILKWNPRPSSTSFVKDTKEVFFKFLLKIIVINKMCGSFVCYPLRNLKCKQQWFQYHHRWSGGGKKWRLINVYRSFAPQQNVSQRDKFVYQLNLIKQAFTTTSNILRFSNPPYPITNGIIVTKFHV